MSSQPIPYPLRMPEELRDRLAENARVHGRSLNAEILWILQDAVEARQQLPGHLDVDALAEAIADRISTKLAEKGR